MIWWNCAKFVNQQETYKRKQKRASKIISDRSIQTSFLHYCTAWENYANLQQKRLVWGNFPDQSVLWSSSNFLLKQCIIFKLSWPRDLAKGLWRTLDFYMHCWNNYTQQAVIMLDLFTTVPRMTCEAWDWALRFPYVPSAVAQQMPVWPVGVRPSLVPGRRIINMPTAAWQFSVGWTAMVDDDTR